MMNTIEDRKDKRNQKVAIKIVLQLTGPNVGKYFATAENPIRQNCLYLAKDGHLEHTCMNGWFDSLSELGEALKKCHVTY